MQNSNAERDSYVFECSRISLKILHANNIHVHQNISEYTEDIVIYGRAYYFKSLGFL